MEHESFLRGPSSDEVRIAGQRLGWNLSEVEVAAITEAARGVEESYRELWNTPINADDPVAAGRDRGQPPVDPCGGWAWQCDIVTQHSGPLAGVRVAIKDSIAVAGLPIRVGSALPIDHVAADDAECVRRLLDAGARILGKSQTEDLCIGGASCTSKPAPLANPHASGRSAGGSSSGSAVLVATGACDLALGADQGGSIRIPAALCGIVGLKPTFGLVPYTGVMSLIAAIDHVGPMARTVAEVARALDVLAGPDGYDHRWSPRAAPRAEEALALPFAGLRIGLVTEGFDATRAGEATHPGSDAAAAIVAEAAARLTALGGSVVEVSIPWHAHARHIYAPILLEAGAENTVRSDSEAQVRVQANASSAVAHSAPGRGVGSRGSSAFMASRTNSFQSCSEEMKSTVVFDTEKRWTTVVSPEVSTATKVPYEQPASATAHSAAPMTALRNVHRPVELPATTGFMTRTRRSGRRSIWSAAEHLHSASSHGPSGRSRRHPGLRGTPARHRQARAPGPDGHRPRWT